MSNNNQITWLGHLYALSDSPVLLSELQALLQYQYDHIDFIDEPVNVGFDGAAYTCLGTVNYVRHDGSRPMNITWKLDRPIPAKFLKKTNKLIVG